MSVPDDRANEGAWGAQPSHPSPGGWSRLGGLARRHRGLVIFTALVGLVVGLVFATSRPSTYQAEARLLVGTFEVPSQAIPGYVLASQSLAENYQRLAETELVVGQVVEQIGVDRGQVRRDVSVTAIPDSAILRVQATSADEDEARRLADAMATSIDTTIDALAVQGDNSEILARFEEATRELSEARLADSEAREALTTATANGVQSAITAAQVAVTETELTLAATELLAEAVADEYLASQQRTSSSSGVRPLGPAVVTEQSRLVTTVATLVLTSLLGAAVGLVLAWRTERSAARRDERGAAGADTAGADTTEGDSATVARASAAPTMSTGS
jgi:capsular polysaccharide biosynthesis protein